MIQNRNRQTNLNLPPNLGCSCTPGLGGIWDDLKAQGAALISKGIDQGKSAAADAAKPYLDKASEGLDKLDMALKIIMALSAIGALTGVINLKRKR